MHLHAHDDFEICEHMCLFSVSSKADSDVHLIPQLDFSTRGTAVNYATVKYNVDVKYSRKKQSVGAIGSMVGTTSHPRVCGNLVAS